MLFSANPGEEPRPLRKIASGGELSRLTLAVKTVLAAVHRVPTLIFDEIDTGVGGRLAAALGQALAELARHHQVICVTHLPQIASYARKHWVVRKRVERGRSRTTVTSLGEKDRIAELAAMLRGESAAEGTRQEAIAMLREARVRTLTRRVGATLAREHQNGEPSSMGSDNVARFSKRVIFLMNASLKLAGRPVAILGDVEHGDSGLVVGVVIVGTMQEQDDVGVLFDRTRLAQVGHAWLFVFAGFDRAVQLGQGDHRHLERAGQRLQTPADLGDLLLPAVARVFRIDELNVIDEDQPDPAAAAHPPRAGGDLKHVTRGRIVDVHHAFLAQLVVCLAELGDFRMIETDAGPELVAVDPGSSAEQAVADFEAAHFQADEEHGSFPVDCNVFSDVQSQGGFAHAGAGGQDDELAGVEAARSCRRDRKSPIPRP